MIRKISINVRGQTKFGAAEFVEAARNQIHLTAPRDRAPRGACEHGAQRLAAVCRFFVIAAFPFLKPQTRRYSFACNQINE